MRLTNCRLKARGVVTHRAAIWYFGPLVFAFGSWPTWESAYLMIRRVGQETVAMHVSITIPLPSDSSWIAWFPLEFAVLNSERASGFALYLWAFALGVVFNKRTVTEAP